MLHPPFEILLLEAQRSQSPAPDHLGKMALAEMGDVCQSPL